MLRSRIIKLERQMAARNNTVTMVFVDDVSTLTAEQIDSPNTIYVYLEI